MNMTIEQAFSRLEQVLPADRLPGARTDFLYRLALSAHRHMGGKLQILPAAWPADAQWLSVWYTPGVSSVSRAVRDDADESFELTGRGSRVAIVTDSTRVLGDGDCTPPGGMGVMEGKALLMKLLGGFDAVPLCLDTRDAGGRSVPSRIVDTVASLEPSFGAVNLEDISQPECYMALSALQSRLSIPVWHDDAQGTACVTLAGLLNALEVTGRKLESSRIILLGAGASNSTTARLLLAAGAAPMNLALFDSRGPLSPARIGRYDGEGWEWHRELCRITGPGACRTPEDALAGADVLIAASKPGPGTVPSGWIRGMAPGAIVFSLANPVPEIYPGEAAAAGAAVIATGRGDFPNQVNNALAFPGVLAGALKVRARGISDGMAVAAARALAESAGAGGISPLRLLPAIDDMGVAPAVAAAVAARAMQEGLARRPGEPGEIAAAVSCDIANVKRACLALAGSGAMRTVPGELIEAALAGATAAALPGLAADGAGSEERG
jgi:malate dehydrogenase (oxaloacetate-decarboxylating)